MRLSSTLTAMSVAVLLAVSPSAPAFASGERETACAELGGRLSGAKCTVTTTVVGPDVPSGTPTVSNGPSRNVGEPTSVDSLPLRQPNPAVTTIERDAGEATSVTTERRGTPVITEETQDAGEATSESVIVAGTPTTTTRTERGTPTTTETPTTTNCRRVNDESAKKPVERCDRAVLTTTTTPTTIVTTVTTPQEQVTTTTQPRETVVTTTTPVTEVVTTTQPRESCTTTTFQTEITTTTTQRREFTATTTQPTTRTTTRTTTVFTFTGSPEVPVPGPPKVNTTTEPGAPIVTTAQVEDTPVITTSTRPGPEESDTVCSPTAPVVTVRDGETRDDVNTDTVEAAPVVTVTREAIEPLVVETEAPGTPIVEQDLRTTGESCFKNPSTAEQRRNRC